VGWGWGWGAPFLFGSAVGLALGSAVVASSTPDIYADQSYYAPSSYYAAPQQPVEDSGGTYLQGEGTSYQNVPPPPSTVPQGADVVHCSAGKFFNTLTESCDAR
ncbi:MAG: hypothetical protein ABF566_11580, partial [Acetobacter sp.]